MRKIEREREGKRKKVWERRYPKNKKKKKKKKKNDKPDASKELFRFCADRDELGAHVRRSGRLGSIRGAVRRGEALHVCGSGGRTKRWGKNEKRERGERERERKKEVG